MTRAEQKRYDDLWRRLNAAQNKIADQTILILDMNEQLDRANAATVRMARRLQSLLSLREAA